MTGRSDLRQLTPGGIIVGIERFLALTFNLQFSFVYVFYDP